MVLQQDTNNNPSHIRIGRIDYTNVWPIFYHFQPKNTRAVLDMIPAVPAGLNQAMREGRIDMGPISAFAYGISSEQYTLFPNLSVSAHGRVNSIFLFLKKPLEEALRGKIALTTTSATSTNLFKIIAAKFYHARPEYIPMDPDLEAMMAEADGAVLIGDHAIRASWNNPGYEVIDLGELWRQWTGHWMTFAVWAVNRDVIREHGDDIKIIMEAFEASKRKSLLDPRPLAQEAVRTIGGTVGYWMNYFTNLNYDFDRPQQEGLQCYFQYAYELGLIDHEVRLELWSENTVG
ncbi:menaquinone biosynthesis protein [Paenibacillus dendritiformis]|uniref:menaquinone biosynthesis protein n=1 Tax=Paenibacillus dendritiformis TaxID=130049 RepID=UPI0010594FBE|nr:menaquinone biosynthesis protein [Paenibacillus dendritiformis]TDL54087.1 ABC transporter substrate-binding protein [Paenibacillus dendritiformis]WGU95475.1 menaquinone biosynthesis protein [Paenibacillus dendritiformis]